MSGAVLGRASICGGGVSGFSFFACTGGVRARTVAMETFDGTTFVTAVLALVGPLRAAPARENRGLGIVEQ